MKDDVIVTGRDQPASRPLDGPGHQAGAASTGSAKVRRSLVSRLRGRSLTYLLRFAALRASDRLDAAQLLFPILESDLADSQRLPPHAVHPAGARPRVGWVVHPPSAGSGGHTTLFRMVAQAAEAGFDCTLLLYNRHDGDVDHYRRIIRQAWPWLDVAVQEAPARIRGFDALVASSWSTAHVIATRATEGRRLYFIQDYEPFFSPRGSEHAFAQDSYRLGFRNIALGEMVHRLLRDELDVDSDVVPFGCDAQAYRLDGRSDRRGVAWYAKRGNDRRGYLHAIRALEAFHEELPDEPIHVYGDVVSDASFPVVNHGNLSPAALNDLYNSVVAGLALSFTNVSLVPEEMLAAGAIPVVNEDPYARMVLDNPEVVWASATPAALAAALVATVHRGEHDAHARAAAASVQGRSWRPTGDAVVRILNEEMRASA